MTITTTRRERGEHQPVKPAAHRTGWERLPDGRVRVSCSAHDFTITLDRHVSEARARRYGDEHRAIVKRIAELQAAGR